MRRKPSLVLRAFNLRRQDTWGTQRGGTLSPWHVQMAVVLVLAEKKLKEGVDNSGQNKTKKTKQAKKTHFQI